MSRQHKAKTAPKKSELERKLEAEMAAEQPQTQDEEAFDEAAAGGAAAPADDRAAAIQALEGERDQLKDQLLRARAEFDNYRKRMAREAERTRKTATQGLVQELLSVLDHLELALEHAEDATSGLAQGVEMVLKQFRDVLGRVGVEPIPAVGEPFDPNVHEAVMRMASDEHPPDTVAQEFQKGYRMGAYVLRPTKAAVSGGPPGPAAPEEEQPKTSTEE